MANNNLRLQLEIAASGAGATVAELLSVRRAIEATAAESPGIAQLANAMNTNYEAAQRFARGLRLTPEAAASAVSRLRELNAVGASSEVRFATLTAQMGLTVQQFQALDREAANGTRANTKWSDTLTLVSFKFNQIQQSIQGLTATLRPAYDLLIGANEQLNQGILSSAATVSSATEVSFQGQAIKDPTAQIKALQGPIKEALKEVEKATLELVGVTSEQTSEIFNTILTNAGQLDGQLKSLKDGSQKFADPLKAAAALAPGLVATLGTLGLPLAQANQEVGALLRGEIDANAQVAKRLGITKAQIDLYKSQGTLVDRLIEKFQPFVAANALAAKSIGGITSNIQDVIQILGRTSGAPLLDALIPALDNIYKYLQQNQDALTAFFQTLVKEGLEIGATVGGVLAPLGEALLEVGQASGPIALAALAGIKTVILGLAPILTVLTSLLGGILTAVAQIASSDLGLLVIQATVITLAISTLAGELAALAVLAIPAAAAGLASISAAALASATALGAATAGTTTLAGALVAIGSIAVTSAAALLAVAAAAVVVAVAFRKAAEIEDTQEALDSYLRQSISLSDETEKYIGKLKKLQEIEKNGGKLTVQQIEQKAALQKVLGETNKSIDETIATLKAVDTGGNEAQANQVKGQITLLEKAKDRANKLTGEIQIQGRVIAELGDDAEQLNKKAKGAFDILNNGRGDDAAFKNAAKQALEATKQQLQLGIISEEEGRKRLTQLRNDKRIEVELRDGARKDLVSLRKIQGEAELAAITVAQGQIEARQKAGRLGDAEAERELTKVKIAEFDKRIAINRLNQQDTFGSEKAKLVAEEKNLQSQRESARADGDRKSNERVLQGFDQRRTQLESLNQRGLIDQRSFNKTKLDNDLRQQDEALRQQNVALGKLAQSDVQGRQVVLSKIAEINGKKEQLILASSEAEKKRVLTDFDERLVELDKFNAKKLISESDYLKAKTANQLGRVNEEIAILIRQSLRLGKADKDGREAINAQVSKLQIQKIKILEDGYTAELVLVKDAQSKALDLVLKSEQQRSIDLQKLVNNRLIRQEDAEKERSRQNVSKQRAELKSAQDFEAALARTAGAVRSPEAERAYQQQVREARAKTLQVTLGLLQAEGAEQERLRGLALKGLEDEVAKRTRAVDLQLSQIAKVRGERDRSTKNAEANANREIAAIDVATKALERQNALTTARNNLQNAKFGTEVSSEEIELTKVNRAIEIRKQLDGDNKLSAQEQIVLMSELASLTGSAYRSEYELVKDKAEIEKRQSVTKRESVLFEQAAARASLTLEQQKIDLANQRLLIEARIAEFKAKQAIIDARSNVQAQDENNRKSLEAAQLAVGQAKALQPGRERDRAIAEAQNSLAIARTEAQTNSENAAQGVDLARQQADLATQNTQQAVEQIKGQAELKKLQSETLDIQQKTVLKQLEAVEAARQYANELERAKAASMDSSTRIVKPLTFGARANGGSVEAGKPYLVGENSPEMFVPNVSGTVLNREQLMKNLGSLEELNLNAAGGKGNDNREVIEAIRGLEQTILSRPPAAIVANFSAPDDGGMDKLFALHRSSLRIN